MAQPHCPPSPVTAAAARRSRVRNQLRTQLAESQRRRQELAVALFALRQGLREFRSQVRMRIRELSHAATARKPASSKTLPSPE